MSLHELNRIKRIRQRKVLSLGFTWYGEAAPARRPFLNPLKVWRSLAEGQSSRLLRAAARGEAMALVSRCPA